jgi:hypothetical protein
LFALILIGLVWQEHIGPVSGFFLIGVALLLTGAIIYVWRRRAAVLIARADEVIE